MAPPIKLARSIKTVTRTMLYVKAGGCCQFRGCNKDILQHELTQTDGNFGETAHIYAFSADGPRGNIEHRPDNIHDLSNLIALCPQCHKLIDDNPLDYSVLTLQEFKNEHEERIRLTTAIGPEMRSSVIILKAPIRGQSVAIPTDHIRNAMFPFYPASLPGTIIDLSSLVGSTETPSFMDVSKLKIQRDIINLFQADGEIDKFSHLSIFGIAPIPLLIFLGNVISNKIPAELYQRHRDTEDWKWKADGKPVSYKLQQIQTASADSPVGLILSLSGSVPIKSLPPEMQVNAWVYEITLDDQVPNPTFLCQKADLNAFRNAYQEALGKIIQKHGLIESISLFPAVPAPVAILCGRELLPKVHPKLKVYDFDHANNGFTFQLEVPS